LLLITTSGCSVTEKITGAFQGGSESFTGTTTGYSSGEGTIFIVSNRGRKCEGQWKFIVRPSYGQGAVHCDDGSSGLFEFNGNGRQGTGSGYLGTQRFTFNFGYP
jgi:hypothetical protein